MVNRERTRQGRPSRGLELEDRQGQGGELEQESRRGARLTAWAIYLISFRFFGHFYELRFLILVLKQPGKQAIANI